MKTLSLVIPVFNEAKRLKKTFKALKTSNFVDGLKLEKVIFVNDGSIDKTEEIIRQEKRNLAKKLKAQIKIISYSSNRGKGFAVKKGMLASHSDYTLMFDADISTPLSEIKKFSREIENNTHVIIGTRKNGESTVLVPQAKYRQWLGRGFTILANKILATQITDFTCGFKAFTREAKDAIFSRCFIERWGYDAEVLFLAQNLGFTVKEKAVLWQDDKQSRVRLIKDLPASFLELLKIRAVHFKPNLLAVRHRLAQLKAEV